MKTLIFLSVASLFPSFVFALSAAPSAPVDWAQPPVACVEDAVPGAPDRACLDLTGVANPQRDWPESLPAAERAYWQARKRPLQYCRGKEVLRREAAAPGTFSAGAIEVAWMQVEGVRGRDGKIDAIYAASRAHSMPAHVLTGALYQESMFVDLGIAEDGGNYSCGAGQVNTQEWCRWANGLPAARKKEMNWPAAVECSVLPPAIVKPFYDVAKTRLNGLPEYRLNKAHFADIPFERVVGGFPAGDASTQKARYQAARSFIDHCSDAANGIPAKANELATLYRLYVPAGMKRRETYPAGEEWNGRCGQKGFTGQYPLHAGWILAVGSYNAGPRAVDALAFYNRWDRAAVSDPRTFAGFTLPKMVEGLYWSGKYSKDTDRIHFRTLGGSESSWVWFKLCVLQRHVARVVQHVTAAGAPVLADTLEGSEGCQKSIFDSSGTLIRSGVPARRQASSGVRP